MVSRKVVVNVDDSQFLLLKEQLKLSYGSNFIFTEKYAGSLVMQMCILWSDLECLPQVSRLRSSDEDQFLGNKPAILT